MSTSSPAVTATQRETGGSAPSPASPSTPTAEHETDEARRSRDNARDAKPLLTRTWCVGALAMVSCLLWGSAIPCIKLGYGFFGIPNGDVPSELLFAGLRFILAGLIAIAAAGFSQRRLPRPKRSSWGMVLKLCLAQTVVQYFFFYVGVSNASGVKGSIINASNTFFCVLIACLVFRQERLDTRKVLGCLVGFAGVVLINLTGQGLGGGMTLTGEGFILIATVSYAVSSALIHEYSQREDPVTLSGYQFVLGGCILTAAGVLTGGHLPQVTPEGIGMLAYLALVSGVAYSVWSILLKHNPTSKVAVFGFMNPVFGVLLSSVLLGEANVLPWYQSAAALVLVTIGIYVVNRPKAAEKSGA